MLGFLKRLFGRTAESRPDDDPNDFVIEDIVRVPNLREDRDLFDIETQIRIEFARLNDIPLEDVRDDTKIGPNGRTFVMGLVMSLGVAIGADTDSTIGDVIKQVKEQLD